MNSTAMKFVAKIGWSFRLQSDNQKTIAEGPIANIVKQLTGAGIELSILTNSSTQLSVKIAVANALGYFGKGTDAGERIKLSAATCSRASRGELKTSELVGGQVDLIGIRDSFWLASCIGCIDIVAAVIDARSEFVNMQDEYGMSPLAWACALGHEKICDALLPHAEKVADYRNCYSWNLADLANASGRPMISEKLQCWELLPTNTVQSLLSRAGVQ